MTTYNWTITQMDRLTSDGFVVTVHYRVEASDDTNTASIYGTVGYSQDPEASPTPYDDLTKEQVVGWVQTSLRKEVIEEALQSQLDALAAPVQESGLPWA